MHKLNYRKIGIGEALLKKFIDEIKNESIHKIYLYSHESLFEAISLYEKSGFIRLFELKNHWFNEDFIYMEKILQ